MLTALVFLVFGLIGLVLYFLPTIIAQQKGHRSLGGIFALNFLLGWSLLGWIGALIWALSNPQPVVIVQNNPAYMPSQGYGSPYPQQPYPPQPYPQQAYPQQAVAEANDAVYVAQPAVAVTPVETAVLPPQQNPPL